MLYFSRVRSLGTISENSVAISSSQKRMEETPRMGQQWTWLENLLNNLLLSLPFLLLSSNLILPWFLNCVSIPQLSFGFPG